MDSTAELEDSIPSLINRTEAVCIADMSAETDSSGYQTDQYFDDSDWEYHEAPDSDDHSSHRAIDSPTLNGHTDSPVHFTTSILDLPPELLGQIGACSSLPTHHSLRLACRSLYSGTMHSYYTKTLRVTKTDLTSKSLEPLNWIAADEQRAAYVRELHVTYLHGHGIRRGTLAWHFRAPCRSVVPQPASQELQCIVRRLSNCDSFWFDHTDPVSDWHRPYDRPPIADALAIILPALADCGRKIREFQFDTQGESYDELKPFIKMNPVAGAMGSPELWSKLEYLSLGVVWPKSRLPAINFPLHILPYAAKLRELTLHLNCEDRVEDVPELLESLFTSTYPFRLESLVLYRTHGIASESLSRFLRMHSQTLREIRFNRVTLSHGSWMPVLKSLATPRGFPALGDICLAELFQPGPRGLGCLDFSKAVQDQPEYGISGDQVRLAHDTIEWHCWPEESICYAGPRMDIAFRRIADGAVLKS